MPLLFSSSQLTLEEKGPNGFKTRQQTLVLLQPATAKAETLTETGSPASPQPLETETSNGDCKAISRQLNRRGFQKGASTSPQHSGGSTTGRIGTSALGGNGMTRGTEPRTKLNHTLGVILRRCSVNCRLIFNSLPRVTRKGTVRMRGGSAVPPLLGRHCGDTGHGGRAQAGLPPPVSELPRACLPHSAPPAGAGSRHGPQACAGGEQRTARPSQGRPPRRREAAARSSPPTAPSA